MLVLHRGKAAQCLIAACCFAALFAFKADHLRALPLLGQLVPGEALPVVAEGIVVSEPTVATSAWGSARCEIALDTLASPGSDGTALLPRPGEGRKVWATLRGTSALAYGDRVQIHGVLRLPAPPRNPGEFDFPAFLETRGILAEIATASPTDLAITEHDAASPLIAAAFRARDRIRAAITLDLAATDPEVAGVISAMVLGAREDAPEEMVDDFKLSGTLHLFAVSGLHVGMIALILLALLRIPRTPRRLAAVLVIVALVCYAFVTGLRPSAVRATVMATILLSGVFVDRPARILNSLGAAALFILAFDPFQALAPGFQLSFSVLLAIALLTRPLQRLVAPLVSPDPFLPRAFVSRRSRQLHAGAKAVTDNLAVSTAASLGSLPLMLAYFHLATPIAVITNCFLVPLAFGLILIAVTSVLFQLVALKGLAVALNNANFLLVKAIAAVIGLAAAVPGGNFYVSERFWFARDPCEVEILDIPKGGAAIALHTRSGQRWLLDTGAAFDYDRLLAPYLRHAGLNRLDGLLLTHGDSRHVGAADLLLAAYPPRETCLSLKDLRSPGIRAALIALADAGRTPRQLFRGDILHLDARTELRVLFPPAGHAAELADDLCLVLQLVRDDSRILFTADSGFRTEKWLLAHSKPGELRSDVLVTGHHGTDGSKLPDFLAAVRPRALVSSSERLPDSLRAYSAAHGIRLFDQGETGAVRVGLARDGITLTGFLTPEPFFLPSEENKARPVETASGR